MTWVPLSMDPIVTDAVLYTVAYTLASDLP